MGILDRLKLGKLKEGLTRTRESLVYRVTRLATAKATIDDELLDQLEEILISADIGMATTGQIIEAIRARAKQDRYASTAELFDLLKDEIRRQFVGGADGTGADPFALGPAKPHVIMVVGINGVGKTTTIGKLAHTYVASGKKVVIAAADTFRAAANEQLEIWAKRAGATLVRQEHGSDPAAVAFDAVRSAASQGADVVIIDTAGRLHTKVNLMEELKKIKRVIQKQFPDAPHEVLLVIDGSTGQNGLQQAKQFSASVGVTGLVLTKLDGTAKGGIVLAITHDMDVPVRFIGVGEKIDDLQPFDKAAFVDALFVQ
jgi:fused signal recognition particle receptor